MKLRILAPIAAVLLLGGAALWFSGVGRPAGPPPYDEAADARQDVTQALASARAAHLPTLVIFGANWCEDCRALDKSLKTTRNAELMAKAFVMVKVDVGNFNRNLDLTAQYGNPTKKGIPAAVLVSPAGEVIYSTRAGELSNARRMGDAGIFEFFRTVAEKALAKS